MLPTFKENDFIIVDKLTPKLHGYQRGDIVVFIPPEKDIPYIKRVI
jgi:signal peptidase I